MMNQFLKSVFVFKQTFAYAFVFCFLIFQSCDLLKNPEPESVLENYVRLAFSSSPDIALVKYFTSNFLEKLKLEQESSRGAFSRTLKFENLKLVKFEIQGKECLGDGQCKMRYFVSYNEIGQDDKIIYSTETKKIALLKLDSEKGWLIDEIDHMKTFHEIKDELKVEAKAATTLQNK